MLWYLSGIYSNRFESFTKTSFRNPHHDIWPINAKASSIETNILFCVGSIWLLANCLWIFLQNLSLPKSFDRHWATKSITHSTQTHCLRSLSPQGWLLSSLILISKKIIFFPTSLIRFHCYSKYYNLDAISL